MEIFEKILYSLGNLLNRLPKDKKWLYPFYVANQLYETAETYHSPALPKAFDGLSLAYASDFHLGRFAGRERILEVIRRLVDMRCDLILLGGDYGEDYSDALEFFRVIPKMPSPTLAVIGNHDLKNRPQSLEALFTAMKQKNIIPLVNDVYTLEKGEERLMISSVDDVKAGSPDYPKLAVATSGENFHLFIPHSPDALPSAWNTPGFRFDLALCGHTHGGQVVFFGHTLFSSSRYRDRFLRGWMKDMGHDIFVSNGVGCSLFPLRIGAKPMIHRITLHSGSETAWKDSR